MSSKPTSSYFDPTAPDFIGQFNCSSSFAASLPPKPPMELLPWDALEQVALAMDSGNKAGKHTRGDWVDIDVNEAPRILGKTIRHLSAWFNGATKDEESGLDPLAHAAADILIAMSILKRRRKP